MINKYLFVLQETCTEAFLGAGVVEQLQYVFTAIRVATPVLVLVLSAKDILTAVTSAKEDDMKKAQGALVKRLIIGALIFFVPTIVNLILNLAGIISGTCGIG